MGKKSSQTSMKTSKQEKKQPLNSLIKMLRPKVYITDSINFKRMVQELTGNGNSPVSSPPPPSLPVSPPIIPRESSIPPHVVIDQGYSPDLSFNSSCFSTPLEGSPNLFDESFNRVLDSSWDQIDFGSQCIDIESFLMEMDSIPNNTYGERSYGIMNQQEVCAYDPYSELSAFM